MTALIFGTKTTGIHEPAIVQAAWLMVKDPFMLTVVERFEQRYNPGKPIELGALATHHILDEELADCPPASGFSLPPGTEYLIGHDVDYDWQVIGAPPVKRICTLALAACRHRFAHPGGHALPVRARQRQQLAATRALGPARRDALRHRS